MSTPSRNCTQVSLALIQKTAKQVAAETAASSERQRWRRAGSAQRSTSIVIAMWARRRVCSGIARKMTAQSMISNERIRPVGRRVEKVARGHLVAIGPGDKDNDQRSELISAARDRIMQARHRCHARLACECRYREGISLFCNTLFLCELAKLCHAACVPAGGERPGAFGGNRTRVCWRRPHSSG